MDKLGWCKNQEKGIKLFTPNPNLAKAYIHKSEEALDEMRNVKSNTWKLATAYYAIYHSLYSLLMEIGVKSEIHLCTILFVKKFLSQHYSSKEIFTIKEAYKSRIDTQYHINKKVNSRKYSQIIESAPNFIIKCKNIVLTQEDIKAIRDQFKNNPA